MTMNRDALLATLIGFGIGLVIMGIMLLTPNFVKSLPKIYLPKLSFTKAVPKTTTTPTAQLPETLSISSPLSESIENSSELLVSGATAPGSLVVIEGPLDSTVLSAPDNGKYAGKITLKEGKNDILVTSYKNAKQQAATVTVFYTTEEF